MDELISIGKDLFSGGDKTQPVVEPGVGVITEQSTGGNSLMGWLDELGATALEVIPTIADNLTKKDPAESKISPDQTKVNGDARLTQGGDTNFLKDNWKWLTGGALILTAGLIFYKAK